MPGKGEIGVNFEFFIRFKLTDLLYLPPAKQAHLERVFIGFADFVRPLASKAPEEFNLFFDEFQKRIEKVSKMRSSRGMRAYPSVETFPSGRRRYRIMPRKRTISK